MSMEVERFKEQYSPGMDLRDLVKSAYCGNELSEKSNESVYEICGMGSCAKGVKYGVVE